MFSRKKNCSRCQRCKCAELQIASDDELVAPGDLTYTVTVAFDEFPEPTTLPPPPEEKKSNTLLIGLITFFCVLGACLLGAGIFYMLRQ